MNLIELTALNEKILPHFHIPLQSGSNKILGTYEKKIYQGYLCLQNKNGFGEMPLAGIGADVIVGFPGESDSDFEDTYSFLEEIPLSYLHVFTFSERPDTVAEKLPGKVLYKIRRKGVKVSLVFSKEKPLYLIT
jgi:threonylcarbamoyladenosine tRNA methylthiotransferase MtaB